MRNPSFVIPANAAASEHEGRTQPSDFPGVEPGSLPRIALARVARRDDTLGVSQAVLDAPRISGLQVGSAQAQERKNFG